MMVIDNKFDFGQTVYLKTDIDQLPRIVTCIEVYVNGELLYRVNCGTIQSAHYEYEISEEQNIELKVKS